MTLAHGADLALLRRSFGPKVLAVVLSLVCMRSPVFATTTSGIDTSGTDQTLPIAVEGQPAITLNAGTFPSTTPSIVLSGPLSSTYTITSTGNMAIGTSEPASTTLQVAGEAQIGNTGAICTPKTEGSLQYDQTHHVMDYCDGVSWIAVVTPLILANNETYYWNSPPKTYPHQSLVTVRFISNAVGCTASSPNCSFLYPNSPGGHGATVSVVSANTHPLCTMQAVEMASPVNDNNCLINANANGTYTITAQVLEPSGEVNCAMQCYDYANVQDH